MIIFRVDVPTSINLKLFRAVVSRLLVFTTAYNSFCFCYLFSIKVIATQLQQDTVKNLKIISGYALFIIERALKYKSSQEIIDFIQKRKLLRRT